MPELRALSFAALRAAVASLKAPTIASSAAMCDRNWRTIVVYRRAFLACGQGEERAWLGALVGTQGDNSPMAG